MMHVLRGLLFASLLLGGPPGAWARSTAPVQGSHDRVDQALGRYNLFPAITKLGRGVSNFFFGWMEIPLGVHRYQSPSDSATGFFTGIGVGTVKGFVRTGVGMYEVVTFLLPYPENFEPILPPLEYFRNDPHRAPLPLE